MLLKTFTISAAIAASGIAGAAQAVILPMPTPAVFSLTTGNNNNIVDGNARTFTSSSTSVGSFKARVTAWSLETNAQGTFVRDSKLMVYGSSGLGIISGDDGDGGSNRHTIDNSVRKDFLLFQFDKQVSIVGARFETFSVLGSKKDSDALFAYGVSSAGWNSNLAGLNNAPLANLAAMFAGSFQSLTTSESTNTRTFNTIERHQGNIWLVAADMTNADARIDGFKLSNLAVIPEPATWAMMIGGFGMVGGALRRRSPAARVAA